MKAFGVDQAKELLLHNHIAILLLLCSWRKITQANLTNAFLLSWTDFKKSGIFLDYDSRNNFKLSTKKNSLREDFPKCLKLTFSSPSLSKLNVIEEEPILYPISRIRLY